MEKVLRLINCVLLVAILFILILSFHQLILIREKIPTKEDCIRTVDARWGAEIVRNVEANYKKSKELLDLEEKDLLAFLKAQEELEKVGPEGLKAVGTVGELLGRKEENVAVQEGFKWLMYTLCTALGILLLVLVAKRKKRR